MSLATTAGGRRNRPTCPGGAASTWARVRRTGPLLGVALALPGLLLGLCGCASGQTRPPTTHCVPVYADVQVPVYGCRQLPKTQTVQVPRYVWRAEPVYREVMRPVYGCKTVPVKVDREIPVVIGAYDPARCEEVDVPLFHRSEPWQVGIRRERAIVGYRKEKVCCGVRQVKVQDGWESRTVPCGCVEERVQVGTQAQRQVVGYRQAPLPGCP